MRLLSVASRWAWLRCSLAVGLPTAEGLRAMKYTTQYDALLLSRFYRMISLPTCRVTRRHQGLHPPIKAYQKTSRQLSTLPLLLLLSYFPPPLPVVVDPPNMSATDQSNPATRVATPLPKTAEKVPDYPLTIVAELPPEDNALANASRARKITLMVLFLTAQFLDAFNNRFVYTLA